MLFNVAGVPMVENCMGGYNSCMFAYGQVRFCLPFLFFKHVTMNVVTLFICFKCRRVVERPTQCSETSMGALEDIVLIQG